MKILVSEKGIPIPKLYFVSNKSEIAGIPKGVPYIFGSEGTEEYIVRIMEYEVIYQKAVASGYPFNYRRLLEENGFIDMERYSFGKSCLELRLSIKTGGKGKPQKVLDNELLFENTGLFKKYIKDSSVYVDISVIKALNIFPTWLHSIEEAVSTNIQNFATYDTNMYNKKLEGMYGGIKLKAPNKNLLVIDISGSIPKAVSTVVLTLAKNLSENFYADILITGSKSTLYDYSEISKLNIETIYDENEMDNDQVYFKELLTSKERHYDTAIVFGDNDVPGYDWSNNHNRNTNKISSEDGKKLCKWKIGKLVSFHTHSKLHVAGYADWFTPDETIFIENWVKDMSEKEYENNPHHYN
tara:strand:- start:3150 stop:4214 length:1065 start_codon:yes stop_codon:yes gene_type:complete